MTTTSYEAVGFQGRGLKLGITSIIFATLAVAAVAGRIASRITYKKPFGGDDYAIVASLIFSLAFTALNCIGVANGYGKATQFVAPENLHPALQTFWACQIAYKITLNLTKISILLLYLRIFPNRNFRLAVKLVFTFVSGYAVSTIIATIFQCNPIARNWDRTLDGTCVNMVAFWYANASASILSDIVILFLPMPLINSLQLPRNQKIGLLMIFGLGFFVCVTSGVRASYLKKGARSSDPSYGSLLSTIWSGVECNTAIICASLPMLKGVLSFLFPKLFPRGHIHSTAEGNEGQTTGTWDNQTSGNSFDRWINDPEASIEGGNIPLSKLKHSAPTMFYSKEDSKYGIPLDAITKTTDIHVEFGDEAASNSSGTLTYVGNEIIAYCGQDVVRVPLESRRTLPYHK